MELGMSQAAEHTITPTARGSKALRSKIEKAPRKKPNSKPTAVSPTYVYEIRVDGLVRYIGKGRNGRGILI
jgi:hypothetical protein